MLNKKSLKVFHKNKQDKTAFDLVKNSDVANLYQTFFTYLKQKKKLTNIFINNIDNTKSKNHKNYELMFAKEQKIRQFVFFF